MGVLVGILVCVRVLVIVGVLVVVGVSVGVFVGVLVGVKEDTTKIVLVGTSVEDGRKFGVLASGGVKVQVGGKTTGVGVLVGISTVGGTCAGGNGLMMV